MSMHTLQFAPRALTIARTLGIRCAAGFLRNRNVSLEDALFMLVGRVKGA
jgi:hypothetical protein